MGEELTSIHLPGPRYKASCAKVIDKVIDKVISAKAVVECNKVIFH